MPVPKPYRARDGVTTWRVRFRLGEVQTTATFPTEREASAFCDDVRNHGASKALDLMDRADELNASPTLDEFFEAFLAAQARVVRSPRTIADYRRDYRRHISPAIGRHKLIALTVDDAQTVVDRMDKLFAPKTIVGIHGLLHGIMEHAARRKLVPANPIAGTRLPKRIKTAPRGLSPAEWDALYRALELIEPPAADLALFLLASGWRWSEAIALHPFDCDLVGEVVYARMGRVMRRTVAGGQEIVDDGKSQAAIRRVALDADASAMMRRRLATAKDLVFTTPRGNEWRYSNFHTRAWAPAVKAANLARKPTVHALRHTHVQWMVAAGASLPELQSRIGHESIKTTIDVYGRMISDVQPAALTRFGSMRAPTAALTLPPSPAANGES